MRRLYGLAVAVALLAVPAMAQDVGFRCGDLLEGCRAQATFDTSGRQWLGQPHAFITNHKVTYTASGSPSTVSVVVAVDDGSGASTLTTLTNTTTDEHSFSGSYRLVSTTVSWTGGTNVEIRVGYAGTPNLAIFSDGTGDDTEVAFFNADGELAGDPDFTFDGTDITLNGDLDFTGPQAITTSSGDLTLAPTGNVNVDGSILSSSDNTDTLGGGTNRFSEGHINTVYADTRLVAGLDTGETGLIYAAADGLVDLSMSSARAGVVSNRFVFARSRGTHASPVIPNDADEIGAILGRAYNGTSLNDTSKIAFVVDGTPSGGGARVPSAIVFITAADGAGQSVGYTIDSAQDLVMETDSFIYPGTDGEGSLGVQTTGQWGNVWADLVNGADIAMANGWRMVESELIPGRKGAGWAVGFSDHWQDGKSLWASREETPELFDQMMSEGYQFPLIVQAETVELLGVEFTREELVAIKQLVN